MVGGVTTRAALAFAPLRRFLTAELIIMAGVFLQGAALLKQVFDITGRERDIAFIGLAEFLPAAALVLVTGWVADHLDRKLLAMVAVGGEMLCSAALTWYSATNPTEVWPFFLIAGLYGVFRAFGAPALRALPPMVAPPGGVTKAVTLNSIAWTSASIVGPAASGLLYAGHHWLAFAGSTALLAAGLIQLAFVRPRRGTIRAERSDRPTLHAAIEGLRFIRRSPMLLAAISLDLFAVLFGGAVALLPAIAEKRLGVGDVAYGWLRAAPGVGAALMGVVLAVHPLRRKVGWTLLGAVGVFGAATIVLGLTRSYVVAFTALLVLAAADMISVVIRGALVPLVTPDDKRGRVLAVEAVFIGASNELGAFESGLAGQYLGIPLAVAGGGVVTIGVVGLWAALFPSLRRLEHLDQVSLGH